jgi:hypothetical protein
MNEVLPWLVRSPCRTGTRDFCSALAALIGPVQNSFPHLHCTVFQFLWPYKLVHLCNHRKLIAIPLGIFVVSWNQNALLGTAIICIYTPYINKTKQVSKQNKTQVFLVGLVQWHLLGKTFRSLYHNYQNRWNKNSGIFKLQGQLCLLFIIFPLYR